MVEIPNRAKIYLKDLTSSAPLDNLPIMSALTTDSDCIHCQWEDQENQAPRERTGHPLTHPYAHPYMPDFLSDQLKRVLFIFLLSVPV